MNLSSIRWSSSVPVPRSFSGIHPSRFFPRLFFAPNSAFASNRTNLRPKFPAKLSEIKIPARDKVIDFGKYKGKMLGTLPSAYLRWISSNLRARDYEDWAKLADEVLGDSVYRDRIEWEFAEKVLNGDVSSLLSLSRSNANAVSELLEVSERFGWDNDDQAAWSRIDFALLGTSKGGRIPRVSHGADGRVERELGLKKVKTKVFSDVDDDASREAMPDGDRRKDRRDRMKSKQRSAGLQKNSRMERLTVSAIEGKAGNDNEKEIEYNVPGKTGFGRHQEMKSEQKAAILSPFPGRESLIKKVLNRKKLE